MSEHRDYTSHEEQVAEEYSIFNCLPVLLLLITGMATLPVWWVLA